MKARGKFGKQEQQQRSVRLTEIGPRLRLHLLKIEQGFGSGGEVIYHSYSKSTTATLYILYFSP
jgi:hypothetical protein